VGLEQGPLSLMSTNDTLLGRKCSGFCIETNTTAIGDPPH
jgi:hypothetical protein